MAARPFGYEPCAWCDRASICRTEVRPELYRKRKGVKVLVERAIYWPACDEHRDVPARKDPDPDRIMRRRSKHQGQLTIADSP